MGYERDIDIELGNQKFRYRAVGIIVEDGCILMTGNDEDDYYYTVGGE